MKKLNSRLLWLIIVITAIVPTFYFFMRFRDPMFRDSAMGNLFATMVGAIIGIMIALEINRFQKEAQEQSESVSQEKEERFHKAKVLKLVKSELEYNRTSLLERQPKEDKAKRSVFVSRLKDELWNAFSDGGELQWIKDLELLDYVSTAYYHIRTIIFLEEKYFEATHFPGVTIAQSEYPKDRILNYLTATDPEVLEHIGRALKEIDESLSALENNKQNQG